MCVCVCVICLCCVCVLYADATCLHAHIRIVFAHLDSTTKGRALHEIRILLDVMLSFSGIKVSPGIKMLLIP